MQKHYIPRNAHSKAVAHYKRTEGNGVYHLRIVDTMTGELVRYEDRKRVAAGMRVFFNHGEKMLRFELLR